VFVTPANKSINADGDYHQPDEPVQYLLPAAGNTIRQPVSQQHGGVAEPVVL
jgi:hypothetical protein